MGESVSMATWKKSHLPTFPSGGSQVQVVREHAVAPHYQPMSSDWTDTLVQASSRDIYNQVLTPGHVDPRPSVLLPPTLTRHQIVNTTFWTLTLQVPFG